jgi:hypothetical protein
MHIFRWDLDKTYLETSFSSFRGLLRTALETAEQKKNVPGSATLLRSLISANAGCRVTVISGSPTQMRGVLEEKFAIDGVSIDDLVLKDNLRNIRRGHFKAVTNQIGYKLPGLFAQRVGLGADATETLFGDDTEADALIYTLYAEALAGRTEPAEIAVVMAAMGTPEATIRETVKRLQQATRAEVVEHIFIRVHRGVRMASFQKLGPRVIPIFSWFQAAAVLFLSGRLDGHGLERTLEACVRSASLTPTQVGFLVQDLARRGVLDPGLLSSRLRAETILPDLAHHLEQTAGDLGAFEHDGIQGRPDYLGFVKDIQDGP